MQPKTNVFVRRFRPYTGSPVRCASFHKFPEQGVDPISYVRPGAEGSVVEFASRYDNFIGGKWVPPVDGRYFENPSPVDGQTFREVARSTGADVELALDAAHAAADGWARISPAEQEKVLHKIADRIDGHLKELAVA